MRAVICRRPGPLEVLEVAEVDRPAVPPDGVLVRVRASSVNPADFFALSRVSHVARTVAARRRPRPDVLGRDFAGTVESVGAAVTDLRPGDDVFGTKIGAFAEFVCVPAGGAVVRMPANLTFEEAAGVPVAAVTALQALRDHGRIQPGQRVLVNGASGGVGTFAVQLARVLGGEVTGVCSPGNVDLARSLGADTVIDYTQEDFTRGRRRCDLLLDIAGNRSWAECRRVLAPGATLVVVGGAAHTVFGAGATLRHLAGMRLASVASRQRVVVFITKVTGPDLLVLRDLLETGRIRSVVDRRYALDDAVAALRYLGEGHARGKVAIDVSGGAASPRPISKEHH